MIREFETETSVLIEIIKPTFMRLAKRGRIPIRSVFQDVKAEHSTQIAYLYSECFPERRENIERCLKGEDERVYIDSEYSYTISLHDRIVGFVLVLRGECPNEKFIYAVGVSRTHRRGWVNTTLKYQTLCALEARGVHRIRFEADDMKIDALNHARKTNARVIATYF